MDKFKFVPIKLNDIMEMVANKYRVVIVDRYSQNFYTPDDLTMYEWIQILEHNNTDNRYDFYYEVNNDEMLGL